MRRTPVLLLFILPILFASCRMDKYLQPGQQLLVTNNIDLQMTDSSEVTGEIRQAMAGSGQYITQRPNTSLLGIPFKLHIYNTTRPGDTSRWANTWRKLGEPPVAYDASQAVRTASQLRTLLRSKGCFLSQVTFDTACRAPGQVEVTYSVRASARRKVDEVAFRTRQADINSLLQQHRAESFIHPGDWYDQDLLSKERERISALLRSNGYYYAGASLVQFVVDTTYDPQLCSILVTLSSSPSAPLQVYHIDNIFIHPNSSTSIDAATRRHDTLSIPYQGRRYFTNFQFVHDGKISPSPTVITRSILLRHGMTYQPARTSNTVNNILGLRNFKLVDINYEESPNSTDTNRLLDAHIRLLNSSRRKLSLSLELTNASGNDNKNISNFITSGNVGIGSTVSYQNCNLFGGAELFSLEGSLLIESPKDVFSLSNRDFYSTFASFETGVGASLDLPAFLLPFSRRIQWQRTIPHTIVGLSTDYQYRTINTSQLETAIERIRFSGSFGYSWSHSRHAQHKLSPINISYTHTLSGEEYYYDLFRRTKDIRFIFQMVNYYLLNTHYEYTFSNQEIGKRTGFNYLHLSVETAGNLIAGIDRLIAPSGRSMVFSDPDNEALDVDFYQYFRFDSEYKHYFYLGARSTFVLRALAGLGLPYGHSGSMPYEKMFFGGGPTSMRAWMVRQLGPGLSLTSEAEFPYSFGDMQLVFNAEHRFPLIKIFEGALFTDIGNIWDRTDWGLGGKAALPFGQILRGFAIDAGLGLRANISIITLRLDFAVPLYDPGYRQGHRWISDHWRWNKIAVNFGINYPF